MDPLYEILAPHFEPDAPVPSSSNTQTTNYLTRLGTLSLADLTFSEPASLLQSAQSHLRKLQALSKRSHKAVISSSTHLEQLRNILPGIDEKASELKKELPSLEHAASEFANKYDRSNDNEVLERRKKAMLLSRNVDRVSDVLELPTLLSSTISAAQTASSSSASSTATSYASALDLHAHIKRLNSLYPQSQVVSNVSKQAEAEIQNLTTILITTLQSQNLKLAAAMRTVGWLRRVAPEVTDAEGGAPKAAASTTRSFDISTTQKSNDGALGTLFLVCRLQSLHSTLDALEPLRDLADQETARRINPTANGAKKAQQAQSGSIGGQSERYLKRYIEIFREQSFNIVSMYKSIFPNGLPTAEGTDTSNGEDELLSLPMPVASFTSHIADRLSLTLRQYMPNITDKSSRESLLTQVLYCAGSLGRMGADFGMMIALLEEDLAGEEEITAEPEWATVMKKHRVQAGRLEVLARGVGSATRKGSMELHSPGAIMSAS